MSAYADLEIHIFPAVAGGYRVDLTLNTTADHGGGTLDAALPAPDGDALSAWFFAGAGLRDDWARMRGSHPQRRICLRLDAGVPELRALPWEVLRDPEGATPLRPPRRRLSRATRRNTGRRARRCRKSRSVRWWPWPACATWPPWAFSRSMRMRNWPCCARRRPAWTSNSCRSTRHAPSPPSKMRCVGCAPTSCT